MRAYVHSAEDRKKVGAVLRFQDGKTMQVQQNGALVAVVAGPDGKPVRPLKLNKKERRKMRAAMKAAAEFPE